MHDIDAMICRDIFFTLITLIMITSQREPAAIFLSDPMGSHMFTFFVVSDGRHEGYKTGRCCHADLYRYVSCVVCVGRMSPARVRPPSVCSALYVCSV